MTFPIGPDDSPTIPCKICRRPTPMLGTKMCDFCWQMDGCLRPENAAHALAKSQALLELPVTFTKSELAELAASPQALDELIDWHDYQSTCGEAADMPQDWVQHHDDRVKELTVLRDAAAAKLKKEMEE